MEKVKWSDLPQEIQGQKEVNWGELPWNLDLYSVPAGVIITPLAGKAAEESMRKLDKACAEISERMGPLAEEEVSQIANDRS